MARTVEEDAKTTIFARLNELGYVPDKHFNISMRVSQLINDQEAQEKVLTFKKFVEDEIKGKVLPKLDSLQGVLEDGKQIVNELDLLHRGKKYNPHLNCVEEWQIYWSDELAFKLNQRLERFSQSLFEQIADRETGDAGNQSGHFAKLMFGIEKEILPQFRGVKTEYANTSDMEYYDSPLVQQQVEASLRETKELLRGSVLKHRFFTRSLALLLRTAKAATGQQLQALGVCIKGLEEAVDCLLCTCF